MGQTVKKSTNEDEIIDLEDLEQYDFNPEDLEKEGGMKEYEKLLFKNDSRLKVERALKLVKMGLFEQTTKKKSEMDFESLRKLDYSKTFKNHELYERVSDHTFFFIEALSEETKEGALKVYAFDVIEVDNVNEYTFNKLVKANAHVFNGFVDTLYVLTIIFNVFCLLEIIIGTIYFMVEEDYTFAYTLIEGEQNSIVLFTISLAALACTTIIKKKYEDE